DPSRRARLLLLRRRPRLVAGGPRPLVERDQGALPLRRVRVCEPARAAAGAVTEGGLRLLRARPSALGPFPALRSAACGNDDGRGAGDRPLRSIRDLRAEVPPRGIERRQLPRPDGPQDLGRVAQQFEEPPPLRAVPGNPPGETLVTPRRQLEPVDTRVLLGLRPTHEPGSL